MSAISKCWTLCTNYWTIKAISPKIALQMRNISTRKWFPRDWWKSRNLPKWKSHPLQQRKKKEEGKNTLEITIVYLHHNHVLRQLTLAGMLFRGNCLCVCVQSVFLAKRGEVEGREKFGLLFTEVQRGAVVSCEIWPTWDAMRDEVLAKIDCPDLGGVWTVNDVALPAGKL